MTRAFLPPLITDDRALGGSTIERSLRFHAADNTRLSRTIGSTSNRRTFTYSFWVKRTMQSAEQYVLYNGHSSGTPYFDARFEANNHEFQFIDYTGSHAMRLVTNRRFKDGNSWYHFVIAIDTTQGTASNRAKLYVNGVQETSFSTATYPSQNHDTGANVSGHLQVLGTIKASTSNDLDGYLAEAHLVDGQQLEPTAFGYTESQTGIWRPKKYEGTHGTNGFYLDFNDNSATTAATIGKDRSGNGNDFTPSNFSVASDYTNDSSLDTPSNNFCTWNAQFVNANSTLVPSEGNLMSNAVSGNNHNRQQSTMALKSGKWYCEFRIKEGYDTANSTIRLGICTPNAGFRSANNDGLSYQNDNGFTSINYTPHEGNVYQNLSGSQTTILSSLTTFANGDILGIALDLDNDKFFVSKNGTFFSNGTGTQDPVTGANPLYSGSHITTQKANEGFVIVAGVYNNKKISADFGQQGYNYTTPPTGFKTICSNNITPPTSFIINPKKHFDILTYTGNDSSDRDITGLKFKPDFVWIKNRSQADWHILTDSVRGANIHMYSNTTDGDSTDNTNGHVNAFIEGGFNVTAGAQGNVNENSENYVAWCWKAGGAAVTNNDGTIASQVSVNSDAGFSIVTYTGNATAGATVGHGLGKVPHWIIIKKRTGDNWMVYSHAYSAYDGTAKGRYMELNGNGGLVNDTRMMNDTAPTSSVFSLRADGSTNHPNGGTFVAYCWSEIPGYSKFGSYVGNDGSGNAGQYVYMGFRPAWVLIKRDTTEHWILADTKRNSNAGRRTPADSYLLASANDAESTGIVYDFLSDGIKFATNSQNEANAIYYYWAFAEQPGVTPFGTDINAG